MTKTEPLFHVVPYDAKIHASAVYAIEKECFEPENRWVWEEFRSVFRDNPVFVAVRLGTAVGFILSWEEGKEAHIAHLGVTEKARGLGVGTTLMAKAENYWRERGKRCLTLNVLVDNSAQIMYYELDFRVYGFRKHPEPSNCAVKMRKTLY